MLFDGNQIVREMGGKPSNSNTGRKKRDQKKWTGVTNKKTIYTWTAYKNRTRELIASTLVTGLTFPPETRPKGGRRCKRLLGPLVREKPRKSVANNLMGEG